MDRLYDCANCVIVLGELISLGIFASLQVSFCTYYRYFLSCSYCELCILEYNKLARFVDHGYEQND